MGTRRKLSIVVDAEYQGKREMEQAESDIDALGKTSEGSSFNLGELAKTGAALGAALGAAAVVAAELYETIGEGADLNAAREKFDNLSVSIDTTGDALLGKMTTATKGLVSQVDLVSSATDIMNLGLAKSDDGVVRLASAVGALNLDMGVLALTLANDSTARLDSLGLSLEDVTAKKKELIASGFIGDAFDEAVLIALEEKMTLLGDASETTAGKMQILETRLQDVQNRGKSALAESFSPVVDALLFAAEASDMYDQALAAGLITQQEFTKGTNRIMTSAENSGEIYRETNRLLLEYKENNIDTAAVLEESAKRTREYNTRLYEGTDAISTYAQAGLELQMSALAQVDANDAAIASYEASTGFINVYAQAGLDAAEASRQQAAALTLVSGEYESLTGFMSGLDGTAESTAEGMNSLATAIIDNALAAEVAAGNLTPLEAAISSINVQQGLGLIDEAQAEELRMAAEQFGAIEEAIGIMSDQMVTGGGITVDEAGKMADAITLVEDGVTASGEAVATFATGGVTNLEELSTGFNDTWGEVDALERKTTSLKDLIIDGLPDEKVITIRINTVGSVPAVGDFNSNAAANSTSVADEMAQ